MKPLILVFLKLPVPGQVKTRLAATLGADRACEVYHDLVRRVLERLPRDSAVRFCFDPPDAEPEVRKWLLQLASRLCIFTFAPQAAGDLGARLRAAFTQAFAEGFTRVAAIGTDCVEFTAEDFDVAWRQLDTHDAVFGPTPDGGYWLVALKQSQPALFENIPWSTEQTLPASLAAAERDSLSVALIRELDDVDTEADLDALQERMAKGESFQARNTWNPL